MGFGLKEIVLGAGILFGIAKANGQHDVYSTYSLKNSHPWNYDKEISVDADLNGDGVKDKISAVDSAGLKGYDYRIISEIKNKDGSVKVTELAKVPGMVYEMTWEDGKVVYYINRGVEMEGNVGDHRLDIKVRNNLYEKRELCINGNISHKIVGVSKDNPDDGPMEFK